MVDNKAEKVDSEVEFRGKLKPLEWVSDPDNDGEDWFHRAWAGEYCYEVGQDHNGWWWQESESAFNPGLVFATPEDAKRSAQSHYQALVFSLFDVLS